ncbi:MAG: cytochrome P450 [Myxococcales bacterium FL481]|nr:MAG: cytochrome P450 [Myxococcales bacterium FL481]
MSVADDPGLILDPRYWGEHGFPHAAARRLRAEEPVKWFESDLVDPFWLVTKHADIVEISRDPKLWTSTERSMINMRRDNMPPMRTMLDMDPPEHTKHRKIYRDWLTPRNVRKMGARLDAISRELVDEMSTRNEGNFVDLVAAPHPLRMICELLGVGREHEATVLQIAKRAFANEDPDFEEDEDGFAKSVAFCSELLESRKKSPREDLASAIANASIDESPLAPIEAMSHVLVLVTAGHDTTASAISGGLLALIRNPGELAKLQAQPELIKTAVDEIVRYVTPTTNFLRAATEDTTLRGVPIAKGQDVCINFASANRDEEVFDAPDEFRVDRNPNPHLGFGTGTHVCIGQTLAKLEMQSLFEELVPRIRHVELAGKPRWIDAYWISSLKNLPIRYELAPSA